MTRIVLLLVLLCPIAGVAQIISPSNGTGTNPDSERVGRLWLGLEGGWSSNYLITNISNLSFTKYDPKSGYFVAIPLQYDINNWLAIYSDPGLIQKNYRYIRTGFFQGIQETHTNTYVQIPLNARFSFGGTKLKGFLDAGIFGAYWATGHVNGVQPNILNPVSSYTTSNPASIFDLVNRYDFNERYQFNSSKDNRYEFGGILGVGIQYDLPRFKIFIEGKKIQPITDQQKKYMTNQVPRYNSTYLFSAGCMIRLKTSHSTPSK